MDAASPSPAPNGILVNEWADFPLGRLVVWRTIVILFWTQVLGSPGRPRTWVGGAITLAAAVAIAVPWALFSRRFGNPLFHNPIARRLAQRTDQDASGLRVGYLLVAILAGCVILLPLWYGATQGIDYVVRQYPAVPAFLSRHFR